MKSNRRKIAILVVVVLLLAVSGILAGVLVSNRNKDKNKKTNDADPANANEATPPSPPSMKESTNVPSGAVNPSPTSSPSATTTETAPSNETTSSPPSESSQVQPMLQFECTADNSTSTENCYSAERNECHAVHCCDAISGDCTSYNLASCVAAKAPFPSNTECPALPFYAVPKIWNETHHANHTISIGAVGDVILESTLQRQAARHGSYAESWKSLIPLLQQTDITYGNFEGTASFIESIPDDADSPNYNLTDYDRGEQPLQYAEELPGVFYSGGPFLQFNYHPMLATNLAQSGFDVVSTANNHCLDRGVMGINSTIQALQGAGVAHAGTRPSPQEPWYALVERKGWRIAWVACTDGTNHQRNRRNRQADLVLDCFSKRYQDLIAALAADPQVHAVVAVVHWGSRPPADEEGNAARQAGYEDVGFGSRGVVYQRQPDCSMRHWTRTIAEAGAAVILGAHPHVLHGWEKYTTSFGRQVLLVHSLANFNSHGGYLVTKPPPAFLGRGYDSEVAFLLRRTSVLLQFELKWNAEHNWAEVSCMSYVPLYRRLSDIGFVEPALNAQNQTTYEIHVEQTVPGSMEQSFVADRFGPLRDYASGGGVYNGKAWEAQLTEDGEYAPACHPFSEAPVTKVDDQLYKGVMHQNEDGSTVEVPVGHCLKCEPQDGPDGCRWCEYRTKSYCTGPSSTKVRLGEQIPWDDCLAQVAQHANCSDIAYAGGDVSRCTCMRPGEPCNIARSSQSQTVYVRQCGPTPRMSAL